MNYLRRQTVCERLRLAERQSYRIVGSSYGERISSDEVVAVLNRARRGIDQPLDAIPSDLMTPDETVERFRDAEITTRELKAWMHRTKNIPPHFHFNKHTVRFSASRLRDWLAGRSRIRRLA